MSCPVILLSLFARFRAQCDNSSGYMTSDIWDLRKFHYECLHKEYEVIIRNILAEELVENMRATPIKHAVFVQCINDSPEEAKWVMEVAEKHTFIKGIVAGVGMTNPKYNDICKFW
ncbi:hypothetical protein KUTeg_006982 [Tegillarca granosa]|uniref:Uncharacterized protein n=1 Tax=Tegillarca granosa TaxID=220873 RepID=A0ABQ9FG39_TEGGR|nr:hypothetical protein KUTeg_006982 [Tegillarca granosa]